MFGTVDRGKKDGRKSQEREGANKGQARNGQGPRAKQGPGKGQRNSKE